MNLEIAHRKIDDADRELTKIFDVVTSEKEISAYKSMLLNTKLSLIDSNIASIINSLNKESLIKVDKIEEYKKLFYHCIVFSLVFIFINPLIGLPSLLISTFAKLISDKKFEKDLKDIMDIPKINKKALNLTTIIDNCYTFLNSRTNHEIDVKEGELNDIELKRLQLANDTIQICVAGDASENIPVEIQDIMRKMLQDDIKTDEQDIEKLIQMAAEKVISEAMEQGRIRTKTTENDKK